MSESKSQRREYPFFSHCEANQFYKIKKKVSWFCNRPLSPILQKVQLDTSEGIKDDMNEYISPNSPIYDSDLDPEYIPDSDSSDSYINENIKIPGAIKQQQLTTLNNSNSHTIDTENIDNIPSTSSDKVIQNIVHQFGHSSRDTDKKFEKCVEEKLKEVEDCNQVVEFEKGDKVQKTTRKNKKTYRRKQDLCYFCETDVTNFARHLLRNHSCEPEVQQIFSKDKKTQERRKLLALLKKKGNFIKNSVDCVKPVKEALLPEQAFLPCTNCLGFYRSKYLYRHRKKCLNGESSKYSQASGQNFLVKNIKKIDQRLKDEVFPRMRPDKISLNAKNDFLICSFGARYLKIHREKHFINVTSRKMRELSRILLELKKIEPSVNTLFDALKPKYYDSFVEATKSVAKYDNKNELFISPTYAINICTSLKQCCDIAIYMIVKSETSVQTAECEADIKTLKNLFESHWRFDISNQAGNDLNLKKFNKITIVPLASDLRLLKEYLILKAEESLKRLNENTHEISAYNILLETIYCRVILLNRRRPGELQRMLVYTYENAGKGNETYEEFNEIVSETERLLVKNFKRVVIRGKRGRGVPVMFSVDTQNHIKELLKVRPNFLADSNPYLFGKPGLNTPIYGYKIIAKYAIACGAKNPQAITCTRLRKHLATLTQLFNLNDNEIEQLSTFMGHTTGVHKSSYRLPDDVYQTVKISKLLMLMEKGEAGEHKGKTLDDIPIDLEQNLLNEENNEDSDIDEEDDNENNIEIKEIVASTNQPNSTPEQSKIITQKTKIHNKRRVLIPWTEEQKQVVTTFFTSHIKNKKPPKKNECEELKELNPELLNNKNWLKIKVFVQNLYSKK